MSRLAVFVVFFLAAPLAGGPVWAQDVGGGGGDRGPRRTRQQDFDKVEEQMLREQLERFLNDSAKWDAKQKRIVFERSNAQDLGPMQVPLAAILGRVARPGDDGKLHVREEVKLRPFAKVMEDFMADGGMEDLEKLRRMRSEGPGENPFKDGIPPRVTKAIAGLMKALEAQGKQDGDDAPGDDEKKAEKKEKPKRAERTEAKKERKLEIPPEIAERLKKRLGDMDPAEIEQRLKIVRDLADQAQRELARMREDVEKQLDEFARSDEGQRLRRRAESEIRRITESEEFQKNLADAQKRAMDFLSSERGQELERRAFEFFESDQGRALRKRLDEFLSSDQGRALAEKLGDMMKDFEKRPFEQRGNEGQRGDRGQRAEPRRERDSKDSKAPRDSKESKESKEKKARLY